MKSLLLTISIFFCQAALSSPKPVAPRPFVERIQSTRFDRSQVKRIFLAPGLGSIILFPCALVETFVGRSEDLKAQISPNDRKTLFLNLKLNSSLPTNLIARCEADKAVFVFDVIPSQVKHQDVVEIRNYYGRPPMTGLSEVLNSQTSPKRRLVVKEPELMGKGSGQ